MKDIVIIGSGGFGREVAWLIEDINREKDTWNLLGFIDDNKEPGEFVGKYEVLGDLSWLNHKDISVICAVGDPATRKTIIDKIKNKNINYPTLIHPSAILSDNIKFGEGCIVCAGCILTVDINIGNHVIINIDSTVGHDVVINDYVTILPSVNVSGAVVVQNLVSVGTNTSIIQNITIGSNSTIGAGSTVIRDIIANSVAVGSPSKIIKTKK